MNIKLYICMKCVRFVVIIITLGIIEMNKIRKIMI